MIHELPAPVRSAAVRVAGLATLLSVLTVLPARADSVMDFVNEAPARAESGSNDAEARGVTAISPASLDELPRSVAILPFENATEEPGIAEEVRRAFYNQFSSKTYADIELAAVDARLLTLERGRARATEGGTEAATEKTPPRTLEDYKSICQTLGCDGVMTGRVVGFSKVFAGVYSELSVTAQVTMTNLASGKVVFSREERISYREGGLSISPIGLVMTAMSAALNLRDIQRVRLVSELGHTLAKTIPEPLGGLGGGGPRIEGLLSNAGDSPFGLGKTIHVAMQGDGGGAAVFDIGQYRRALPMQEKSPGLYVGEYRVQDGDAVRMAPVVVTLRARNGLSTSWYDPAAVTLDSSPPPAPARLSARSHPGKVVLRWDDLSHTPDLAGYQVLRSNQPLHGYKPLGTVDHPEFSDTEASDEQFRYYRVVALDKAGNVSDPGPVARGRVLMVNAPPLTGRIAADRELAGQQRVQGELRVPAGVTLTLAPGTRIRFAPGASLRVEGALSADALEEPVELVGEGAEPWRGVQVAGGNLGLRGFVLAGAGVGLDLESAQGIAEGGLIRQCETALRLSGPGGFAARELRIQDNRTGVLLERGDGELMLNRISGNVTGVEMRGFSGVLRDNAILQNTVNLRTEPGTLLEANYWGSLDPAALRIEGGMVKEALNRPAPDGKAVALRVSPCAGLDAEGCQRKATEALLEGGQMFRAKNYGRALHYFDTAIAAQPSADAYYFIALCHQEMQEPEAAIERLREGVHAFPNDPALRKALGMLHLQRGEHELAREQIVETLRLSPRDRQAAFVLQRLDETSKKPAENKAGAQQP